MKVRLGTVPVRLGMVLETALVPQKATECGLVQVRQGLVRLVMVPQKARARGLVQVRQGTVRLVMVLQKATARDLVQVRLKATGRVPVLGLQKGSGQEQVLPAHEKVQVNFLVEVLVQAQLCR